MSEVVEAVEKTPEESSYTPPPLDSVMDKVQGKAKPETESVTEPEAEKESVVETVPETPAETPVDAVAEPETPELIEPEAGKPPPGFVPVKALQSERERKREIEAQLQAALLLNQQWQMQQMQPPQYSEVSPAEPDPDSVVKNQVVSMSEELARQTYKDYDEKVDAFKKAALAEPDKYRALYASITSSGNPAKAAYAAGVQILEQQKYGADVVSDPVKYRAAIAKEIEAELKTKIEAETHKKIQGKLTERSKTPTDISGARSAGGATEKEWSLPSLDSTLKKVQKHKGR